MSSNTRLPGRRNVLIGLGASLLVAGCAAGGPAALYGLNAATSQVEGRRKSRQVLVPRPRALKALDTEYIAVVDHGPVYSYYPKVSWADALPSLVQTKVVETLQNTNLLRGVGLPGDGLLIDYQLQLEIRSFEIQLANTDKAVVSIAAKLVNDRNGRTVSNRVFRAEIPASARSADKAVEALNRAADQVFSDIALWTVQNV